MPLSAPEEARQWLRSEEGGSTSGDTVEHRTQDPEKAGTGVGREQRPGGQGVRDYKSDASGRHASACGEMK